MPLSFYRDCSFYVMRNDSLNRFGTRLERRFTRDLLGSARPSSDRPGVSNEAISILRQ